MLTITVGEEEYWDNNAEQFVTVPGKTLQLEHSLVSISKWEAKFHKPFMGETKNREETIYYVKCMTLTQNVPQEVYAKLTDKEITIINAYIDDPMTATKIYDAKPQEGKSRKKEIITSEQIYSWMIALQIPVEFQKWHLNRLMTLIRVVSINNNPEGNKMSKKDTMKQNAALNAARQRARHKPKG